MMAVTRSGGTGSRRGDDEGGVTHRDADVDRVEGGAETRQQFAQLRRWKVAVVAGRGIAIQDWGADILAVCRGE